MSGTVQKVHILRFQEYWFEKFERQLLDRGKIVVRLGAIESSLLTTSLLHPGDCPLSGAGSACWVDSRTQLNTGVLRGSQDTSVSYRTGSRLAEPCDLPLHSRSVQNPWCFVASRGLEVPRINNTNVCLDLHGFSRGCSALAFLQNGNL